MAQEIITGYTGERHISPEMDAGVWRSAFGENNYILATGHQCEGSMPSNVEFVVKDGVVAIQGYLGYGTHTSLQVDPCASGYKRIDLVCARYAHDLGTLIDSMEYVIIKGAEVAHPAEPVAPAYNTGIIKDGANEVDFPLYRIEHDGLTVTYVQLAKVLPFTLEDLATVKSLIGNTNISTIGDGTITGAINAVKTGADGIIGLNLKTSTSVTDFNDLTTIGVHYLGRSGGISHSPTTANYWTAIVYGQGNSIKQIASPTASGGWYARNLHNGTWTDWVRLDNINITGLDLKTTYVGHFNVLTEPGVYNMESDTALIGAPTTEAPSRWSVLVYGGDGSIRQVAANYGSALTTNEWYVRTNKGGTWSSWKELTPDLSLYAMLSSPTFTGFPKAPTAETTDNTTQIATTAFVKAAIAKRIPTGASFSTAIAQFAIAANATVERTIYTANKAGLLIGTVTLTLESKAEQWRGFGVDVFVRQAGATTDVPIGSQVIPVFNRSNTANSNRFRLTVPIVTTISDGAVIKIQAWSNGPTSVNVIGSSGENKNSEIRGAIFPSTYS